MKRRAVVGLAGILVLAACSSSSDSTGPPISVTSSNSECLVANRDLAVGTHTFEVRNTGNQPTEVYVYAPGDKVVSEKKGIEPGTTARFTAELPKGYYQMACKPGQKGSGIREALTVA